MAGVLIYDAVSLQELIVDPQIPGQIGYEELVAIARIAKTVPSDGVIVETGSLFGRSSFVWSKNVGANVKVYCIDPWIREQWIIELVETVQNPELPFSQEAFRHYTRGCTNISMIQGFSPDVVKDWQTPVDLYFDDSVHEEPGLSRNLNFWIPFVKPGGVVCGDDYGTDCPDVVAKVSELSEKWGACSNHTGRFWWLTKPAADGENLSTTAEGNGFLGRMLKRIFGS